jgi:hypothetical protein
MATKQSTIFSTNAKTDTSGISAKSPRYGYAGQSLPPKDVAGGELYLGAIDDVNRIARKDKALSSPANMRKAAGYVNQGLSTDHAFDVVGQEVLCMPDKTDVLKASAKLVKSLKGKD